MDRTKKLEDGHAPMTEPSPLSSPEPAGTGCDEHRCFVGYLYDSDDSGMFNGWDVFHEESNFPDRVREGQLGVWLFKFCPKCGRPLERQAIADKLGLSLDVCGEA